MIMMMVSALSACGGSRADVWMPFSEYTQKERITSGRTSIIEHTAFSDRIPSFASDFAVFEGNVTSRKFVADQCTAALLINADTNEVLYADNAFEQRYPASITKLMTAYVALKYMSADSYVVVDKEALATITDPLAVMLGVEGGDTMTLDQALRLMLLSSYNDVAVAVGNQVGNGSVDSFMDLVNTEALKLGCTGTHFTNPSGLHDADHYTTAYDLYLMFKEFIKDPYLLEIIQSKEYSTTITRKDGSSKEVSSSSTNQFFRGNYSAPANMVVVGGKTGTTDEAGRCLMIMVRDKQSVPYIAIVLGAGTMDDLYGEMSEMLTLCDLSVN